MRSVYSGTVALQSGSRDYDAMEKQNPYFTRLWAFETSGKRVYPSRSLAKEDDFSDPPVLNQKQELCSSILFIYSVHHDSVFITPNLRFSVRGKLEFLWFPDFRQIRFSKIPDFRQVGISVTVLVSQKVGTRIFRNHPIRPVPSQKLGRPQIDDIHTFLSS